MSKQKSNSIAGVPSLVHTNAFASQPNTTQSDELASIRFHEDMKLERNQSVSSCSSIFSKPRKKSRRAVQQELRAVRDIDVPLNFTRCGTEGLQEWRRIRGERRHVTDQEASALIHRHKLNLAQRHQVNLSSTDSSSHDEPELLVQVKNKGDATHVWHYTLRNGKPKQTFWRVATMSEIRSNINSKRQGTPKTKENPDVEKMLSEANLPAALEEASKELHRLGVDTPTQENACTQGDVQLLQVLLDAFHIPEEKTLSPEAKGLAAEFIEKLTKVVHEKTPEPSPDVASTNVTLSSSRHDSSTSPAESWPPKDCTKHVQSDDEWMSIFEDEAVVEELTNGVDTDVASDVAYSPTPVGHAPLTLESTSSAFAEVQEEASAMPYTRPSDSSSVEEYDSNDVSDHHPTSKRLKRRRNCSPSRDSNLTEVQKTIVNLRKRRLLKHTTVEILQDVLEWPQSDPNKASEFLAKNGVQAIAKAMKWNRVYIDVQELGCRALGNLLENNSQTTRLEESVAVICNTMEKYSDRRQVRLAGCVALQSIFSSAAASPTPPPALPPRDLDANTSSSTCSSVTATKNSTRYLQRAMASILETIKDQEVDCALQEYGCQALHYSVQGMKNHNQNITADVQDIILRIMYRAKNRHPGNERITNSYLAVRGCFRKQGAEKKNPN